MHIPKKTRLHAKLNAVVEVDENLINCIARISQGQYQISFTAQLENCTVKARLNEHFKPKGEDNSIKIHVQCPPNGAFDLEQCPLKDVLVKGGVC